ncbi:hypothetical protein [Nocardioides sp. AE5]|uniref:hypothetical protein n=1 Tax=Nocardioides sp. AE5 TaxID=2962573 RepID=UPI002880DAED|nr:hypothetical protein [Nocardioides sp. AE5]MDT0201029.1 hypothetical protein [Nocardioides sp. AE5]
MKRVRLLLAALMVALLATVGTAPSALADQAVLDGEPVPGLSTDPENPVDLTAGRWQATLEPTGSDLQFSYTRTSRDSSVFIAVNGASTESDQGYELRTYATNADRTTCGDSRVSSSMSMPAQVLGVNVVVGPKEHGSRDSQCLITDVVRFTIGRGNASFDEPLPLSITIVEESPLQNAYESLPTPPDEDPAFVPPTSSEPTEVVGGTTLADAPLLEDGSVTGTIAEGQQLFYRVHLDWGQSVAAQVDVEALDEEQQEIVGGWSVDVGIWGYNPVRRSTGSLLDDTDTSGRIGEEGDTLTYGYGPVRYLNRYGVNSAYAPGDYYLVVGVPPADDREAVTLSYTLTVEVQGEPVAGPTYVEDEPFLIGPEQRSAVVSGTPRMSGDESDAWFTGRRITGLGLGVLGLVCLGVGALRLRR